MKIFSYVLSMADDCDLLPDALDSLAKFSDRIFVVDGLMGAGTLSHHPRFTKPLFDWLVDDIKISLPARVAYDKTRTLWTSWNGVPLILYENEFHDPAHQRNFILQKMAEESDKCDWIVWIDSDEICSNEFIEGVRLYLESLPENITNVCPKWLTLVQDEQHYFPDHSNWLSHARIHRPNTLSWRGNWHEDGQWSGDKVQWDTRIIHSRMLFRRRLYVQRGHFTVRDGWKNAECIPLPDGIATWHKLTWPKDEMPLPFDQDAREVWDNAGNLQQH